jgi:hypothetical protein
MTKISTHFSSRITKLMIAYYAQDPYFLDLETMLDENDFRFITEDIVSDKARPIEQVINFIESNSTILIFTESDPESEIDYYIACKDYKKTEKKIINIIKELWEDKHKDTLLTNQNKIRNKVSTAARLAKELGYKLVKT